MNTTPPTSYPYVIGYIAVRGNRYPYRGCHTGLHTSGAAPGHEWSGHGDGGVNAVCATCSMRSGVIRPGTSSRSTRGCPPGSQEEPDGPTYAGRSRGWT